MGLNGQKVNLFIVGAAKCGTTTLHDWLDVHAEAAMCRVKEPNFFATHITGNTSAYSPPKNGEKIHYKIITDEDTYNSLFDITPNKKVIGESSVIYLWDKDAPKKIYDYNPSAKIIIILRNPIDRAYSHYLMMYSIGQEQETDFLAALKNDQTKPKIQGKSYLYLDYGHYYEQIKRYQTVFPKNNILLLSFKDLIAEPTKTASIIYDFLGLTPQNIPFSNSNSFTPSYGFQRKFRRFMSDNFILHEIYLFFKQKIGFDHLLPVPQKSSKPPFTQEARAFLKVVYQNDMQLLEEEFNIKL
jgi:hypothetical protein